MRRRRGTVWTTYGVVDSNWRIRYVGYTERRLATRMAGHVGAAHDGSAKWPRWLQGEMDGLRPVGIIEIATDYSREAAIAREAEVIADLISSGAELLNTAAAGKRRCLSCGLVSRPESHTCVITAMVRVSFTGVKHWADQDTPRALDYRASVDDAHKLLGIGKWAR